MIIHRNHSCFIFLLLSSSYIWRNIPSANDFEYMNYHDNAIIFGQPEKRYVPPSYVQIHFSKHVEKQSDLGLAVLSRGYDKFTRDVAMNMAWNCSNLLRLGRSIFVMIWYRHLRVPSPDIIDNWLTWDISYVQLQIYITSSILHVSDQ
jgi:hypothetical protein